MSELITADWQIQRNGYLLGDGTDFDIVSIQGLAGAPATRPSDRSLSRRHGAIAGEDYLGSRAVTLGFDVVADSSSTLGEKLDTLARAFAPSVNQVPTFFRVPGVGGGGIVQAEMHVRNRSVPVTTEFARGVARCQFQLAAADPRLYSATLKTDQVSATEATTAGLTFSATFDLSFGGAINPGTVETVNAGTFAAPLTFRVYGPVTDPVVTRGSDGAQMSFTTTVADRSYLEVNGQNRTVLLNGVTNNYSTLDVGSTWLDVPAGTDELRLTRTGSDTATLAVYYRDTYV